MAASAYLPSYSPYSTVTTSMQSFMGTPASNPAQGYQSSPLQYNMPLDQLRQTASPTTLNQPRSSSDRIRTMSDRSYERWKADSMFKDRVYGEFEDAVAKATSGLDRTPNDFNAYKQYLSNTGVAGLLGGTVAPVGQRMQDWNKQLFESQAAWGAALKPVYSQFGMLAPQMMNAPISTLQNNPW